MSSKKIIIVFFVMVFVMGGIFAESCVTIGEVVDGQYCDVDGELKDLFENGVTCLNDYNCIEASCVEGVCQGTFPSFEDRTNALEDIWYLFSGEECDPELDLDYKCEGAIAFLCGANYVWENKGEIPGVCGVPVDPNDPDDPNNPGGPSSIKIVISSPKNVTYGSTSILLDVSDAKRKARYWRYALNGEDKVEFTPGVRFTADLGSNELRVYASKYSSFSGERRKTVFFNVVSSGSGAVCGNGICGITEDCSSCALDCGECVVVPGSYCGDDVCDSDESSATCLVDCEPANRSDYRWLFYVLVVLLFGGIGVVGFFVQKKYKQMRADDVTGPLPVPKFLSPAKPVPGIKTFQTKSSSEDIVR